MKYPVGNGTLEDYLQNWYDAQPFGQQTSYGFHEGADFNLRTGANTDLGQPVKSIAKGQIVYYHKSSHPNNGFGRHIIVRIDGAWGTRWVHYAHLQEQDFLGATQEVQEGQVIGRLGNSGTPYAHLHFAIYKVDPASLANKIDSFAHNSDELNRYWENPVDFINRYMQPITPPTPQPDVRIKLLDENGIKTEGDTRLAIDRYKNWDALMADKTNLQNAYNSLRSRLKVNINSAIDQTN